MGVSKVVYRVAQGWDFDFDLLIYNILGNLTAALYCIEIIEGVKKDHSASVYDSCISMRFILTNFSWFFMFYGFFENRMTVNNTENKIL